MSYQKISQKEARRLQKRVRELEDLRRKERSSWTTDYPRGLSLGNWTPSDWFFAVVKTARRLGHPVVVTHDDAGKLHFFAAEK